MEKVVATKHLRLSVETEEERRARLENDTATKWLRLAIETDEERKARLNKMVATTQLRLALETEEERRANLILIEIGVFKKNNSRNELARPVMGTIFLVIITLHTACSSLSNMSLHISVIVTLYNKLGVAISVYSSLHSSHQITNPR